MLRVLIKALEEAVNEKDEKVNQNQALIQQVRFSSSTFMYIQACA